MKPPRCRVCGRDLDRQERETLTHYHTRTRCSAGQCLGIVEESPAEFPYVDSARLDQAPPRCPREGCGGLWRGCDEGLVCRACGRRWRTAESLRALLGRAAPHSDWWPTVRMTQATARRGS